MIADLHVHYAIHLLPSLQGLTYEGLTRAERRARGIDRSRAQIVALVARFLNHETPLGGWRVEMDKWRAGGIGAAMSVLYSPFAEFDLAPLGDGTYLRDVMAQLQLVEEDIKENHGGVAAIVTSSRQLADARAAERVAVMHCVEGGFHLGATRREIEAAVDGLARRGVTYVTLAHLIYREIAANANAFPFLTDGLFRLLFPQPRKGLSALGRAAVEAMVRDHVLVDVAHMSDHALHDTLNLLDRLDPARRVAVIASHSAYRFGRNRYNLDETAVRRIVERGGVIGLILAEKMLLDGDARRQTRSLEESAAVIRRGRNRKRSRC